MKFTEFNLSENLLKGIEKSGYVDCTPVQEQVIKAGLDGSDLYVQSQTGTGKTAAFLVTIIQEILTSEKEDKKVLIMVPTRELAVQVEEEAKYLASETSLKAASFYGGVGYGKQTALLKKNIDIIIGTPGRIIDLQEQHLMDLSNVAYLVVDEADRMFDMGFYPELRKLLKCVPSSEERQTMLFSATLNTYVKNLAWEYTREPKEIEIEPENITVEEIHQELFHVSSDDKMRLLLGTIKSENPESLIIFCNTKKSCEIISKRLRLNDIESEYIIGDLPQSKRLQVLDSFKRGSLKILVATDVAARGIDVDDLAMVINYDLPNEAENYVHRIGRTARAGKSGKAYTFCSEQDVYNLPAIERYIDAQIPSSVAYEEQMIDDKSSGVYIKLDRYDDDHERRSGRGGKRNYNRDGQNRKSGKGNSENYKSYKGNGKQNKNEKSSERSRSDFRNEKNKNYKNHKNSGNKNYKRNLQEEEKLASLPFEERMKIYREKYGNSANASSRSAKSSSNAKSPSSANKNYSNKNASKYEQKKTIAQSGSTEKVNAQTKTGFLAKLKSLFGGKK